MLSNMQEKIQLCSLTDETSFDSHYSSLLYFEGSVVSRHRHSMITMNLGFSGDLDLYFDV